MFHSLVNDDSNIDRKDLKIHYGASLEVKISCYSYSDAKWFYKKSIADKVVTHVSSGKDLIFKRPDHDTSGFYYCNGIDHYTRKHFIAKSVVIIIGMLALHGTIIVWS